MSRGNWVHHPAIGIGIALAILACAFYSGLNYYGDPRGSDNRAANHEERVAEIARAEPAPPRNPIPDRPEWRAESDLEAQWDAARWTLWGAVAAFMGVGVTIIGLRFIRDTLEQTKAATAASVQQASIARKVFEEAERPLFFVSLSTDDGWLMFDTGGTLLTGENSEGDGSKPEDATEMVGRLWLHNVGTRPAFGVSLETNFGFVGSQRQQRETDGFEEFAPGDKRQKFMTYLTGAPILERLRSGERLLISGVFVYDDAVNIRRERGFQFEARFVGGIAGLLMPEPMSWHRTADGNYDRRIGSGDEQQSL